MITIDHSLCIGCGACVRDCPSLNLFLDSRKANAYSDCMECGHCAAICPEEAISIPGYDMSDMEPCPPGGFPLDAEAFLRELKARRSIRRYKPDMIEPEKARMLIEAIRYTATACNRQSIRPIFVQKRLPELKELVWSYIEKSLISAPDDIPVDIERYRDFFRRRKKNPADDYLFRNAPAVLFFACEYPIDVGMAAQNAEHMALSLGLGAMYNGFLARISNAPSIARWLETDEKTILTSMLLGYPAVTYRRTAPRKSADVIWK